MEPLAQVPPGQRPPRTLKVVLGLDCTNGCSYCALKKAHGFEGARGSRLQPRVAEPLIRQAAGTYDLTGLEVGGGETFDYPDLWEWILGLNARELKVPVMAFTSGLSRHTTRVLDAMAASVQPVFLMVSYDGRRSERNAANWRAVEAAYRAIRTRLAGSPQVSIKLTACVTPGDVHHLKENFLSLLELGNASFAFRPIKRTFDEAARHAFIKQLGGFLQEADQRGVRMAEAPEGGPWELRLKRDWTCHRLGISLLPDGRFTDCYVAWYCSDFPASRTLSSLAGLDRHFADADSPAIPRCGDCLDAFDLCNLCPAGLADFRRATGREHYDPAFCRMVNQASLLLLERALAARPGLEVLLKRGSAETRVKREATGVLLVRPTGRMPLVIDPCDSMTELPIDLPAKSSGPGQPGRPGTAEEKGRLGRLLVRQ